MINIESRCYNYKLTIQKKKIKNEINKKKIKKKKQRILTKRYEILHETKIQNTMYQNISNYIYYYIVLIFHKHVQENLFKM